ncbi:DUF6249 domain-containing protein [Marinimicrobium agarilyticum]|uniref:DUF6249 domain-containing protein n=1 Tax=Marinimicrobium agarilyticum TaxID=306546 RepID=UPI0012F6F84E|nr:DUF6249 domain-containing protein [Marinimicrobium agarilyticum]
MNHRILMNRFRLAGLMLLTAGLALGALPAMAEVAEWQQHMPGSIPGGDAAAIAIPIVGILMVFGAPALTVILVALFVFRHRERRQQLLNERIQKFLESGQPVPENLMADSEPVATPERHLNQGLICLGAGIGFTVFLTLMNGFAIGSLGLILIGVGLAKVLIWKLSADKAGQ